MLGSRRQSPVQKEEVGVMVRIIATMLRRMSGVLDFEGKKTSE